MKSLILGHIAAYTGGWDIWGAKLSSNHHTALPPMQVNARSWPWVSRNRSDDPHTQGGNDLKLEPSRKSEESPLNQPRAGRAAPVTWTLLGPGAMGLPSPLLACLTFPAYTSH